MMSSGTPFTREQQRREACNSLVTATSRVAHSTCAVVYKRVRPRDAAAGGVTVRVWRGSRPGPTCCWWWVQCCTLQKIGKKSCDVAFCVFSAFHTQASLASSFVCAGRLAVERCVLQGDRNGSHECGQRHGGASKVMSKENTTTDRVSYREDYSDNLTSRLTDLLRN
jgi:hypothetical protein